MIIIGTQAPYIAPHHHMVVVVYPLPRPLLVGESDHPACGPQASLSLHLPSSSITSVGSAQKSSGDNVVRMSVQLTRWCVSCVDVTEGA